MRSALLLLALSGCLDPLEPEVGPPLHARCDGADSDPDVDVSFEQDIRDAIIDGEEYHCTRCHTAGGETPIGLEVGGLDLSTYSTLRAGGNISGDQIVVPGDACASILVQKLSEAPPFGSRMPLDGPPFLDDEDMELIVDWIAEGAGDD
ncbi:MAG TPA: c-type cytochrome domain-containing protein [Kofleriaceae bacterium]|nr:c-type cytochrome domain-containing protein [Kofleriaceae bacterium]